MAAPNCKLCGRPSKDKYSRLCDECIEKERKLLISVKNYIKTNSKANINDIHRHTGISKYHINRYLREGKIVIALSCSNCGRFISSASSQNLCDTCRRKLLHKIKVDKLFRQ